MGANWKSHLALFLVALIYGANYTIAKEVLDHHYIQPLGFILLRASTATVFFWIIHIFWIRENLERKDLLLTILCGLFGVAINQMFFFSGLKFTTPINASLIMTINPILVLIIASFLAKEKITALKVVGILLGMGGAALLILAGREVRFHPNQLLGDFMIFINASSYGIYLVLVKGLMKKYHPLTVVKWVFSFGTLFILPFGASQLGEVVWSGFPVHIWWAVGYVLLFTTIFAYLLNALALKNVSATVASVYIYLQPVLATAIALVFAKDVFSYEKGLAAILIFTGVYLVSGKRPKRLKSSDSGLESP